MNCSLNDFLEMHRPLTITELLIPLYVKRAIKKYISKQESFVFASNTSGAGKHETLQLFEKMYEHLCFIHIDENTTVNDFTQKDAVLYGMNTYLNMQVQETEVSSKPKLFIIEENVLRSTSCLSLLNVILKTRSMCIYLYTNSNNSDLNTNRHLKNIIKKKHIPIVYIKKIRKHILINYLRRIVVHMNRTKISKQASVALVTRVHGNLRYFLKFVYYVLDHIRRQKKSFIRLPHVLNVHTKIYMDSTDCFVNTLERCNDKIGYTLDDRINIGSLNSYGLLSYCHKCVMETDTHPFTKQVLSLRHLCSWSDIFSLADIFNDQNIITSIILVH